MRHYLLYLLFFPLFSFSQIKIKAVVCNSAKEALPYTNIASIKTFTGTATDQNGEFELEKVDIDDTIKVSNVAYKPKYTPVKLLLKTDTVYLDDDIRILNKVVIRPHREMVAEIGFISYKNNASFMLGAGGQLASYIRNKQNEGTIKGVYFQVENKGKCKNTMRVRIFSVDTNKLGPMSDLLNENVLIDTDHLKHKNYIDLSKYDIIFPKEGVFLVLEWVVTDVACDKNSYTLISANMSVPDDIVWFNVRDKHWSHGLRSTVPNGNFMTPNVGLKVSYPY